MPFRRQSFDPDLAVVRPAVAGDLNAIARLLSTVRHYLAYFAGDYLPELLGNAPASVLETRDRTIWGAVVSGLPIDGTTWLRALVLADGLPVDLGVSVLLPSLHTEARRAGVQQIYYGGDALTDSWLAPRLQSMGYSHDTYVITYAKSLMDVPSRGHSGVQIRVARRSDLPAIIAIDAACFESQWIKQHSTLTQSFEEAAYVSVVEIDQIIIGYALVMGYFGGKQFHLVRVAVHPQFRGQAVGVRLLADVIAYAHAQRATMVTLNTQEYNLSARGLYEWFGFQPTGERQLILRFDLE